MRRSAAIATTALFVFARSRGARAQDAATVRVGVLNILSDAPFIVADAKGYFRAENLTADFIPFHSAADMVVPLGADQLDVGAGAATAGVFNGYVRGLNLRIVADKASNPPGYGFDKLLVRTDLVTSGRYKVGSDLRGLTLGENATVMSPAMDRLLRKYGLAIADVHRVNLDYGEQIAALRNGKVDVTITTEPQATLAVQAGIARDVMGGDTWYPYQEIAVVIYAAALLGARRAIGLRFMRAYLRGARFYAGALKGGRFAGPNAAEVIAILSARTSLKDPAIYRAITPSFVDPDGKLSLASLRNDLAYFRTAGLIEGPVTADQIVDLTLVEAAVRDLGPAKPAL